MQPLSDDKFLELKKKANEARILLIKTLTEAKSGHSAGALGMTDIFTAFYFHILNHKPEDPDWEDRDRLILSNGHICTIRYVTMAQSGYFPIDELKTLRKINSRLQGHPHRTTLPGLETTSGPLGEGLSQAIGIALAGKLDKKTYKTFVIISDGEINEGNTWEAILYAGKIKLQNLITVVDRNRIQIDGNTEEILPLEPLKEKFEAFNWNVIVTDGNDIKEFINSINKAYELNDKPVVIIANTIPGKGVSFMENDYRWHGIPPDVKEVSGSPSLGNQAKEAIEQLENIDI